MELRTVKLASACDSNKAKIPIVPGQSALAAVLHVNRESRHEALKFYTPVTLQQSHNGRRTLMEARRLGIWTKPVGLTLINKSPYSLSNGEGKPKGQVEWKVTNKLYYINFDADFVHFTLSTCSYCKLVREEHKWGVFDLYDLPKIDALQLQFEGPISLQEGLQHLYDILSRHSNFHLNSDLKEISAKKCTHGIMGMNVDASFERDTNERMNYLLRDYRKETAKKGVVYDEAAARKLVKDFWRTWSRYSH